MKLVKTSLIALLFFTFCFVSGKFLYESSLFNVSEIEWDYSENEFPLYTNSLQNILDENTNFVRGKSIWTISIYEIENKINQLPWVRKVSISRRFPNKLIMYLELKRIVANVVVNSEKVQPVSDDGALLETVKATASPTVPFLISNDFKRNPNLRFEVVNILNRIPREGLLSQETISSIEMGKDKSFWFALKSSKTKIALNAENTEIKVARVNKVLNYLEQNQIKGRVIDSNFSKKVLVKLRNHE